MIRIAKILAILNALAAAAMLIVVPMMIRQSVPAPQELITVARQIGQSDSPFLLDVLSKDIVALQHRTSVLSWLCYGALPVLGMNALAWAVLREHRPERRVDRPKLPARE